MIKVGLTGGIGSGKSTVARVFETLQIPVYNSDIRAKWLQENNDKVIAAIKRLFGESIYTPTGQLNRVEIGKLVFTNKQQLEDLNAIIHPAVAADFEAWYAQQSAPYCIKEAAILFESGANKGLDKTITVSAPQTIRLQRVIARDNTTSELVLKRMANQWDEARKIELSDFVIVNDDKTLVIPQVLLIHSQLTAKQ